MRGQVNQLRLAFQPFAHGRMTVALKQGTETIKWKIAMERFSSLTKMRLPHSDEESKKHVRNRRYQRNDHDKLEWKNANFTVFSFVTSNHIHSNASKYVPFKQTDDHHNNNSCNIIC
jgi:hypothetical protein